MKKQPTIDNHSTTHTNGQPAESKDPAWIITIGASAGGLEAIHEFFDNMPHAGNYAFVVIQHLSPSHKSLLVELVGRHTRMKVVEAEQNVHLQQGNVYIIPNNKVMTIRGGKVQLAQKTDNIPNTAIDAFLYSLALDKGDHAIAVILSGTGSDGTRGAEAIKDAGGLVFAQTPDTAKFDGMPNSVINAGKVDFVLPPVNMPAQIIDCIREGKEEEDIIDEEIDPSREQALHEIIQLIKVHTGQDFTYYKPATILRRIEKRMVRREVRSMEEYIQYLKANPEEAHALYKNFLIGVTRFFRDQQAFRVIEEKVLPDLVKDKKPGDILKVWVNACSTGEEAYSIAIIIDRFIKRNNLSLDIKLFATDLDEVAIEQAGRGMYPASIEKEVDADILEEYFNRDGIKFTIAPHIRKRIVFARHNVLKDPPFINNDLISCRNMLIYMDSGLQSKVLDTIDFSLLSGGYLFLGTSEHLSQLKHNFVETDSKWKVYKKVGTRNRSRVESVIPASREYRRLDATKPEYTSLFRTERRQANLQLADAFKDLLAEQHNYAALYIDRKCEVKEAIGEFTRFLSLPEKKLNFHLLKMLLPELVIPMNVAIRKAWKENTKQVIRTVRIRHDERTTLVNAVIKPAPETQPHTLIVLWETEEAVQVTAEAIRQQLSPDNQALILELEEELQETRNNLQMAVEGLETANEELQSSNEELLSANEELQSSNEELQSLNEELHTLNTEHQIKIRELIELNDDLNNYFSSTDIGQVFVDSQMRIRKFNPAAVKLINLIESDIGRPIDHISSNIEQSTLVPDIKKVLQSKTNVEREIKLSNGATRLMRIFPYIRSDKRTDGAVISFIDISVIKNLDNIISGIFNSTVNAIIAFKAQRSFNNEISDFKVQTANKAADILLQRNHVAAAGISLKHELPHLVSDQFFAKLVKVVEENKICNDEYTYTKGETTITYELIAVKLMDGVIITYTDITDQKDAELRLRKSYSDLVVARDGLRQLNRDLEGKVVERTRELSGSEERFRLVSQATNDAIWDWDFTNNHVWYSENFYQRFHFKQEDTPAQRSFWLQRIHPDDRQGITDHINRVINRRENKWSYEYRFMKGNGEYAWILDRGNVLQDEYGTPYRMLGSMMDITDLRRAEKAALENNEQKEFLADTIPMIVWTANSTGKLELVNQQFALYTGISEDEALEQGLEVCIQEHYITIYQASWKKALANKREFSLELLLKRADGEYRWQQLGARPMMNEYGELTLWVGTILEIHDRKVAQEVLEHRVKERTEELERINKELELSNVELQQYAFVASHDLKEPTRKIYIFSNMIRDMWLKEQDTKAADLVNRIINSSGRMMTLIEDLLNYSKLSQDGVFEPINLANTVNDILADLEVIIAEKKATVEIVNLCEVYGVQAQLRQVFQNLISNALKFSRKDVPPHIKISAHYINELAFDAKEVATGDFCRIQITDNGIGFNEKFLDKIFALFQRLHTQEKYEGTGIGLAITRKIVDKHHGIITAKSKEGEGTTFTIVLPRKQ